MLEWTQSVWHLEEFTDSAGAWLPSAQKDIFFELASTEMSGQSKRTPEELLSFMTEYESLVKIALLYLKDHPNDTKSARALCSRSVLVALRVFRGMPNEHVCRIALRILLRIGEKSPKRLLEFVSTKDPCEVHPESAIIVRPSDGQTVCTLCELVIET